MSGREFRGEHDKKGPPPKVRASTRFALTALASVTFFEAIVLLSSTPMPGQRLAHAVRAALPGTFAAYAMLRAWVLAHPGLAVVTVATVSVLGLLLYRWWLLFWFNEVIARLAGTKFLHDVMTFPFEHVDLMAEIARRPPGHDFIGLTPRPGRFGRLRWEPVYLSPRQRGMHRHVMGKTGSGKTLSVLWPSIYQRVLDGQGVVALSGKGSNEEVLMMQGIAQRTGRERQLRIFSLPAWNQPQIFSHTYNMVYVRPAAPGDAGGDPVTMADRVFRTLPLGDNEYYNVQANIAFRAVARLLHGMVDEDGRGLPFVLKDMAVCFRGLGGDVGNWSRALEHCLAHSRDREAAAALQAQVRQLGKDVAKCFSGICGALDSFNSPLVNAYAPDIIFEELLEQDGLLYVQLPANLFPIQAPAIGRAMLCDIQQEGSLRQVFRHTRSQRPFSVVVDEFYNFADLSIIDSLNKLRDAKLEYTLAHQSIADLELVSREFAQAVWDNTRTKDILAQDNPELCERLGKSIGTKQVVERTVRVQAGPLATSLTTGDASSKLVEAFRLHPNRIKSLAEYGQGYFLFGGEEPRPLCYGMLPPMDAEYPLPANDQAKARGLRLYERFIAAAAGGPAGAPPAPREVAPRVPVVAGMRGR